MQRELFVLFVALDKTNFHRQAEQGSLYDYGVQDCLWSVKILRRVGIGVMEVIRWKRWMNRSNWAISGRRILVSSSISV